jgi:alpha-galactosidase
MNSLKKYFILGIVGSGLWSSQSVFSQADPTKQVALTPPMGWNSWNCLEQNINEASILAMADAMVRSGLKDVGYEYLVIDDGWEQGVIGNSEGRKEVPGRNAEGVLLADTQKFPNGIRPVADYVHNLGLKFGIYTSPGRCTCGGHTGSLGYEKIDVETFARWGVDFIKLDFCGGYEEDYSVLLDRWHGALARIDRPIVLSTNVGYADYCFIRTKANMWRTSSDLRARWEFPLEEGHIFPAIKDVINLQTGLYNIHGPGGWCDPDMLQLGNQKLTDDENRAHFSMWAMLAAPLIAGNDLRKMSETTREILTNAEVIAVDQDPAGLMGRKVRDIEPRLQIWTKRLQHYGVQAVALLNHTDNSREITATWQDLGIRGPAFVRDLWQHKDLGEHTDHITALVPAHGVAMFKVVANEFLAPYPAVPPMPAEGVIYEAEDWNNVFAFGKGAKQIPGYSGLGYIIGSKEGWSFNVVWNLQFPADGAYDLTIRYYHTEKEPLLYDLIITSGPKIPVRFAPCGEPPEWKIVSVKTELKTGGAQVVLQSTDRTKYNELAVDYLKIAPVKP